MSALGSGTIKRCNNAASGKCRSEHQDKKYGRGMRVMSIGKAKAGGDKSREARCTVCTAAHIINDE